MHKLQDFKEIKVALVGVGRSGKTSIVSMLTKEPFNQEYLPTIGVNIRFMYDYPSKTKMVIWDLADCNRFHRVIENFINNANVLIFCYNQNEPSTFIGMLKQYDRYKAQGTLNNKKVLVVATHADCQAKVVNTLSHNVISLSSRTWSGREELINDIISDFTTIPLRKVPLRDYPLGRTRSNSLCCTCLIL